MASPAPATQGPLARFWRDRRGTALVEFAISLPLVLVIFATIVESGRTLFAYQAAIAGVRDASRYLGRAAPLDICDPVAAVQSLAGFSARVTQIVTYGADGNSVLPGHVTVDSVVAEHLCEPGDFRVSRVPVARVTATVSIALPFAGLFTLVGGTIPDITTEITDTSRIFGI